MPTLLALQYNFYTVGAEEEFEYDDRKSVANRAKHGIDFDAARALWRDQQRAQVQARSRDEPRWLLIGVIDGKHWSAVFTERGERIRIISVRRSRADEVKLYEG